MGLGTRTRHPTSHGSGAPCRDAGPDALGGAEVVEVAGWTLRRTAGPGFAVTVFLRLPVFRQDHSLPRSLPLCPCPFQWYRGLTSILQVNTLST